MPNYKRDFLTERHSDYEDKFQDWNFHLLSYLGGQDYQNGYLLNRYVLESDEEYIKRMNNGKSNSDEDITIEEIVEREETIEKPKPIHVVQQKKAV